MGLLLAAAVLLLDEGVDRAEVLGLVLKDTVPPGPILLVRFFPILVTLVAEADALAAGDFLGCCAATFFLVVNCNLPFVLVTI